MAGNFTVDARGIPVVSKDPEANWENDAIQFARLIAEMKAAGYFERDSRTLERRMLASMDITGGQLAELVERAEDVWEGCKDRTPKKKE